MYILLYVCIAVVLFSLGKAVYTELLKKKSKEHTTARFQYPEKRHRIYGRYAEPRWNPVYEYCVGQVVYKVEADVMSPTKQLDESDVEENIFRQIRRYVSLMAQGEESLGRGICRDSIKESNRRISMKAYR